VQSRKVQYLEGLRGIAAMQVVLFHFVTGFMPETAEHAWPPLRILFDGHTAVYVFFLISGAVLTPSFARSGSFGGKFAKRVVRLLVPIAAAATIALVLLAVMPDAHRQAAAINGSAWLAMDSSGATRLSHLVREIGLDSMLLGYRETTLFTPWAEWLPPMELSLDAPFWSLHLELFGSLLVLGLVTLRAHSVWGHRIAVVATALAFGAQPMFLFVLGHCFGVACVSRETPSPLAGGGWGEGVVPSSQRPLPPTHSRGGMVGLVILTLGFVLCAAKGWQGIEWLRLALGHAVLVGAPTLYQFQSQLAAVALYLGVIWCPLVWRVLEAAPCRHLGRLSFGIYLLHFPILFTLVCLTFIHVPATPIAFVVFLVLTLFAAIVFERLVDRPAIALSRRIVGQRRSRLTSVSA